MFMGESRLVDIQVFTMKPFQFAFLKFSITVRREKDATQLNRNLTKVKTVN